MRVIVCVKAVPAGISKVTFNDAKGLVDIESCSLVMNESDDIALEEALRLKKERGFEVSVITVGNLRAQTILYQAMAKGANSVLRIDAESYYGQATAELLSAVIGQQEYDLILTGVESLDSMCSQIGITTAQRLGVPFAYAVTEFEIEAAGNTARVVKELGRGVSEVLSLKLPALLCIQSGTCPVSYVPAAKLLRARKEPIRSVSPESLGFSLDNTHEKGLRLLEIFPPPAAGRSTIFEGTPEEVARALKKEIDNVLR